MELFFRFFMEGLAVGLLYAICALGFVLIFRLSGGLNLAQGQFAAVGALLFLLLYMRAGLPCTFSFVLTLGGSFTLGCIFERFLVRQVARKEAIRLSALTLGVWALLKGIVDLPVVSGLRAGPDDMPFDLPHVPIIALVIISLAAFGWLFRHSSTGVTMRAVSENAHTARSLGVPVKRVLSLSWGLAILVAAASGMILAMAKGMNVSEVGTAGLNVFPVVLLGGLGSFVGAIIGGILVGLIESLGTGYFSPSLGAALPYMLILLLLAVRTFGPSGKLRDLEP